MNRPRELIHIGFADRRIGALSDLPCSEWCSVRECGLDQKALAAQLGMDQSVLSRYERGVFRLPSAVLVQIARALKTSTDEILGLKETKGGVVVRDRRFLKRLPAIDALPERQKDALLTTIDGLLRNKAS